MYLYALPNSMHIATQLIKKTSLKKGSYKSKRLSDGELYLRVKNKVQGKKVFVLGSSEQPDSNIVELIILINALKESGARKVILVLSYVGYARQDKQDTPGSPITVKALAQMLKSAGIYQFVTIDIHSKDALRYFYPRIKNIEALSLFAPVISKKIESANTIIVGPDKGAADRAKKFAKLLKVENTLILEKHRPKQNVAKIKKLTKNSAHGKSLVIIDDIIDTAGTLVAACNELMKQKPKEIIICATHGILSDDAIKKINKSPIKKVYIADTHSHALSVKSRKITMLPIASLLAKHLG